MSGDAAAIRNTREIKSGGADAGIENRDRVLRLPAGVGYRGKAGGGAVTGGQSASRVAVIGAGAVGGVVAAILAERGHDITLCARRPLHRLVVEINDTVREVPVRIVADPDQVTPVDWVDAGDQGAGYARRRRLGDTPGRSPRPSSPSCRMASIRRSGSPRSCDRGKCCRPWSMPPRSASPRGM